MSVIDENSDEVKELAMRFASSLPEMACRRSAMVALGIVATSLIEEGDLSPGQREELVETFCRVLRKSSAPTLQ